MSVNDFPFTETLIASITATGFSLHCSGDWRFGRGPKKLIGRGTLDAEGHQSQPVELHLSVSETATFGSVSLFPQDANGDSLVTLLLSVAEYESLLVAWSTNPWFQVKLAVVGGANTAWDDDFGGVFEIAKYALSVERSAD